MPDSTDAQHRRRKDAVFSACFYIGLMIGSAALLGLAKWHYAVDGLPGAVLIAACLLDLGMVIPVIHILKTRLNEIDGGEEDAAAQY